jgi:hypothetical protein
MSTVKAERKQSISLRTTDRLIDAVREGMKDNVLD